MVHKLNHSMAQSQVCPHPGSPEVQIAVFEAQVFLYLNLFINIEGRRFGGVEYANTIGDYFDITGSQFGVFCPWWPQANLTTYLNNIFVAHLAGSIVARLGFFRVEYHLHDAVPIPQVDEYQAAVVTTAVNPAGQGHPDTGRVFVQLA
jgi:hypothetical protein